MHPQPASKSVCCHLNACLMSWPMVFPGTFPLNTRKRSSRSERSYHKVDADEKILVLIHTGCTLADEVWCVRRRLSSARRTRWTSSQRMPSACRSPAWCESARVPVGIKGTERWGEGQREGERWGRGEIVQDDHGAANSCTLWLNLSSITFRSKWHFIFRLHRFHSN